ncbi:MAG: phosphotransferase family protein [Actinomycetota bacterium]|nr:phosphotransferase family protein [Actinomycetota bacterium]
MSDQAKLSAWLAEHLGARHVEGVERLSGGASRETYRFVADGRPLVVQRQRPGGERSMPNEADLVRLVARHGVPVAPIIASGTDDTDAGFIVTELVLGETIARRVLRDERYERARSVLVGQLGAVLGVLHGIDPGEATHLQALDQLATYRQYVDELGIANPTFELAFRWLAADRPSPSGRGIVHGDFRLGNFVIDELGLVAVLDWELSHVGDPMEDLGWLCSRAWRFGARAPVAGVGGYDELFGAYEQASGIAVDSDVVQWWRVLATLKWGVMCVQQARIHLDGLTKSHELAAIGRRVSQTEHDLLTELEAEW